PIRGYSLADNDPYGARLQVDGARRHQRAGTEDNHRLNWPLRINSHTKSSVLERLKDLLGAALRTLRKNEYRDTHVDDPFQPFHALLPAFWIGPVNDHGRRPCDPSKDGNFE